MRAGIQSDAHHGAVVPPIHLSANYSFAGLGQPRAYDYSRSGNPTRDLVGEALAELEGGAGGIVTATGMAAVTLVLTLVRPGERVIAPYDCYGGTHRLLAALQRTGHIEVELRRLHGFLGGRPRAGAGAPPRLDRDAEQSAAAHHRHRRRRRLAHAAGALVAVDNTFLSPAWQQPIELGADLVVHSTTKYINGHSDVVGGAVIARDRGAARGARLVGQLPRAHRQPVRHLPHAARACARCTRACGSTRRTPGRSRRGSTRHPAVRRVFYPGLPDHAGHALAARQQRAFGAIVSFELAGGEAAVRRFVDGLRCFSLAESLGGVESLVAHPGDDDARRHGPGRARAAGITPGLLRLSVGHRGGGRPARGPRRGTGAGAIASGAARSGIGRNRSPQ